MRKVSSFSTGDPNLLTCSINYWIPMLVLSRLRDSLMRKRLNLGPPAQRLSTPRWGVHEAHQANIFSPKIAIKSSGFRKPFEPGCSSSRRPHRSCSAWLMQMSNAAASSAVASSWPSPSAGSVVRGIPRPGKMKGLFTLFLVQERIPAVVRTND